MLQGFEQALGVFSVTHGKTSMSTRICVNRQLPGEDKTVCAELDNNLFPIGDDLRTGKEALEGIADRLGEWVRLLPSSRAALTRELEKLPQRMKGDVDSVLSPQSVTESAQISLPLSP